MQNVTFVKEGRNWYVDLPEYLEAGGKKDDCLMVSGAPELIEILAAAAQRLQVEVSPTWISGFSAVLSKKAGGNRGMEDWSFYFASVYACSDTYSGEEPYDLQSTSLMVGLCPVNAWVFGGRHPDTIYLKKV